MKIKQEKGTVFRNVWVTVLLMLIATAAAGGFFMASGSNSASIAIIYVMAVMLVARSTDGYIPGIAASIFSVISVNYAFTYPFMKLNFTIAGYPVTFLGMLIISIMTSALTTRYKKQSELLMKQEKLLMEAEKETMRANLLRAVSHDLRTPLTGIIGMARTYVSNGANMTEKEKTSMVNSINEDATWLLNMVENLLTVTRIQTSDARVSTSMESVEEVVSEAVQRTRRRHPDIRVRVRVPEEFLMIPMDATLIEQVIINLLENALYHSGVDDEIDFYVETDGTKAIFHVRDFGHGIEPERLATIFDGAGADPNGSGDSHKGMGIGLTICKTIVKAHRGEIYAVNRNRGAEFIFELPLGEEKTNVK